MAATRITAPAGMVPRTDPSLLAPNQAQQATNCVLTDGRCRSLAAPLYAGQTATQGPLKTIYRVRASNGTPYWLSWAKHVNVVRGPLSGDKRYYYSGDGEPRKTTIALATQSGLNNYPSNFYALGVPAPKTAPTIGTITGGTGTNESRSYLSTYVTEWGEESAPSDPSTVEAGLPDATWNLSFADSGPANSGTLTDVLIDTSDDTALLTLSVAAGKYPVLRVGAEIEIAGATGLPELNGKHEIIALEAENKPRISFAGKRSNILPYSEQFDEWTLSGATVSADTAYSPGYTLTADKLIEDASNGEHYAQETVEFYAGRNYAFSVYAEPQGRDVELTIPWPGFETSVLFDLNAKTATVTNGSPVDLTIEQAGDTQLRCCMVVTAPVTGAQTVRAGLVNAGARSYQGDSASGAALWGGMVREGVVAGPYVRTERGVYDPSSAIVSMVAPWHTNNLKRRIYRLVSGDAEDAWMLVDEIDAALTAYADSKLTTGLDSTLKTRGWLLPPGDLRSLRALPNGALAGASDNVLCVSVPSYPHAWPLAHQHALDDDIVAISPFDRSIAIATKSRPAIATGVDPAQLSIDKIEEERGCIAEAGVAAFSFGMVYPSKRGLALLGVGGLKLAAPDLWTEREWKALSPETIQATEHENRLYAIYQATPDSPKRMFILDRAEPASLIEVSISADAIYADDEGQLFIVEGNAIYEWDASPDERLLSYWHSKEHNFPRLATVAAISVDADFTMTPAEIAAARGAYDEQVQTNAEYIASSDSLNGAMNCKPFNVGAVNDSDVPAVPFVEFDSLNVTLHCDGEPIFSGPIFGVDPIAMPDGYKARKVSVSIGGNVPWRSFVFGEDFNSLGEV